MSIERRRGTLKQYVTTVERVNGRLRKRYIGSMDDPVVSYLMRTKTLANANRAAREADLRNEIEIATKLEHHFVRLEKWSAGWLVTDGLVQLIDSDTLTQTPSTAITMKPPRIKRFKQTCRLANQGDEVAKQELEGWIAATPGLYAEATSLVAIARDELLKFASGSPETEALLRSKLDGISASLSEEVDDGIGRLYAEAVSLAWMDMMRCGIGALRVSTDTKTAKYWDAATDRATRRWTRIQAEYQKYLKQVRKRSTS
ncbi:hypothetical protein Poly41_70370 [Novipirellula artificiosorum]|uniref:Uncharacterized protein n=2 Tax=Novipirellula artificiosorum TaxID=2528016 RepID=A0A5C6CU26_9BACT|nr:hypothetical protein Poly41_70370 [Novipirellula artificiosorum]